MVDGKIMQIEVIPSERRREKNEELDKLIQEDKQKQEDMIAQRGGITEMRDVNAFYAFHKKSIHATTNASAQAK